MVDLISWFSWLEKFHKNFIKKARRIHEKFYTYTANASEENYRAECTKISTYLKLTQSKKLKSNCSSCLKVIVGCAPWHGYVLCLFICICDTVC